MSPRKKINFGNEISKMQPVMLREMSKRHMLSILSEGLSFTQIAILDFLQEKGACKMSELAEALNLTMGAITGIVDKMIKLKLVTRQRSRKDRRIVRVAFLKKGRNMVRRMNKERTLAINNIFAVFNAAEKREYLRLVTKMYNNLCGKK